MAHQHPVVDSDIRFAINPITRAITRVEAKKSSLIVGDHNSERFTFEIPKIVEGHDMTLCNVIRIHYLNTSSENKSVQSLGVYEVDDFAPDPEDENILKFSWLISRKATKYVGPLSFTIQFACMTGFKVDYSWQSGIFSGITVANSVNGAEVVVEEYADILRQWWEQLYASSDLPITVMPMEDFEALNGNTRNGMLYILSDDPAVEDLEKISDMKQHMTTLDTNLDNLEEKVETIEEKIPNIEDRITGLNTRLVSVEEKVEDEVNPAIQKIPGMEGAITTLNTLLVNLEENVDNLDERADTLEKNIGILDAQVDYLNVQGNDHATALTSMQESINRIDSKWCNDEYIKLYEFDTETSSDVITEVACGMYVILAKYVDSSNNYAAYTTAILDTLSNLERNFVSTSISFPDHSGKIIQYRIVCMGAADGKVKIFPDYVYQLVSIDDEECNWKVIDTGVPTFNVELYGRCIYTNAVG